MSTKELLIELRACEPAREWAGDKTIEQIVAECHRGDWLLWLAAKVDIGLRPLTLAKGHCANTVRHLMMDERSVKAVDTAIAFGEGKVNEEGLKKAYAAAAAAAAAKENRLQTAEICRKYIGDLIIEKVKEISHE